MKDIQAIKKQICLLRCPELGYNLVEIDSFLWGKSSSGETVFGFAAKNINVIPMTQTTKHLKLFINHEFRVTINSRSEDKKISLLILRDSVEKHVDIFIKLAFSMMDNLTEEKLLKYFLDLKDLFSNEKKTSKQELEGIFGELLVMYVLKIDYDVDISVFYQRKEKRKFDFSLTEVKKIEVKATLKPDRVHHFLLQQLNIDRYDIKVVSIMFQKDDAGTSLLDLIDECKRLFSNYFDILLLLEFITNSVDEIDLEETKFNFQYAKDHMKIYDAVNMPRIKEKNTEGVFNVEYDVDLTNAQSESYGRFIDWITSR